MSTKRKIVIIAMLLVASTAIGATLGTVAAGWTPKHGWPGYCATHPRSTQPACEATTTTTTSTTTTTVPVTTTTTAPTTTTTTSPLFTGCIVVAEHDPTTILFEGDCTAAEAFASSTTEGLITYPVTGITPCDPNVKVCRY